MASHMTSYMFDTIAYCFCLTPAEGESQINSAKRDPFEFS